MACFKYFDFRKKVEADFFKESLIDEDRAFDFQYKHGHGILKWSFDQENHERTYLMYRFVDDPDARAFENIDDVQVVQVLRPKIMKRLPKAPSMEYM